MTILSKLFLIRGCCELSLMYKEQNIRGARNIYLHPDLRVSYVSYVLIR